MACGRLMLPADGGFVELFDEHGKHFDRSVRAFVPRAQNDGDRTLREKPAAEVVPRTTRSASARP